MTGAAHIRWFHECSASSAREVGGKCVSLGEMIGAGLSVPPGFAVTTAAHELFLESRDVRAREADVLASVDYDSLAEVTAASQQLRALVESSELLSTITDDIRAAYAELCGGEPSDAPVAVRSSAVAEDLAGASFAGQLETYLWVRGAEAVVEHVRRCWGGFFTPEALMYRHRQKIDSGGALMSVGVQRMVRARSAGVMFTLNPVNGDRSKVVIESTWGLGEPLVAGEVDPDRFVVDKVMLDVLDRTISEKAIEHRPDPERGEVVVAKVENGRRSAASISDAEAVELARVGKAAERHYGSPQDMEWAIDADTGSLLLLQARPETVWSSRERQPTIEKRGSALEYVLADLLSR